MELIVLSLIGSLGIALLHLLDFISQRPRYAPFTVASAQITRQGDTEPQTTPRAAEFHQRLQDQQCVKTSARYAEDLLADRLTRVRSARVG